MGFVFGAWTGEEPGASVAGVAGVGEAGKG